MPVLNRLEYAAVVVLSILSAALVSSAVQVPTELSRSARAIIDRECVSCHGEAKVAGLDLRQPETILKGGKKGPAVVPGNADGSLLYQAAAHTGALKMPPGSKAPLRAADLKVLRDWISTLDVWRPPPP